MIKLSHRALADLEDIKAYTQDTWGRDQWLRYFKGLTQTFEAITRDPHRGRNRDLLAVGLCSVNYGRHIIFYKGLEAAKGETVILRILHQSRNLPALVYYDDLDGIG